MKRTLDNDLLIHDPFRPSILQPLLAAAGGVALFALGLLSFVLWAIILEP